ncbi:MAG TPA: hypothetical protein VEK80_14315, partial [Kribbellaceae bacterium]|nr:hypothetical protein [Kribbellaceae bacterium]
MAVVGIAGAGVIGGSLAASAQPQSKPVPPAGIQLTSVDANPKVAGLTVPNALSPELAEEVAAQGSRKLENGTADIPYYGYLGDGPL